MRTKHGYRLALDINTSAIGAVTYRLNEDKQPYKLDHLDVRIFSEPVADAKTGTLKKALRREKRSMRRQVQRRAQRMKKIAHLFELVGLSSEKVYEAQKSQKNGGVHKWRSDAVEAKISLEEMMTVFLLMAKNRGYEGRFTKAEDGKVAKAIDELKKRMEERGCDTLGQLLYKRKVDSEATKMPWKKISETGTYAQRDMLQEEFKKICDTQEKHHDILKRTSADDARIGKVYEEHFVNEVKSILPRENKGDAISIRDLFYLTLFDQRPIWWDKESIGRCELEQDEYRASRAHPVFQEYRIEQILNDLELKFSKSVINTLEKEEIESFFGDKKTVSVKKLYEQFTEDSIAEQIRESLQNFHKVFNKENDSTASHWIENCFLWRNKDSELKIAGKRELRKEEKEKIRIFFHQHKEISAKTLYKELGIIDGTFTHDRSKKSGEKEHTFKGNVTAYELKKLEKDANMELKSQERELFIEIIADIDEPSFFGYDNWQMRKEVLEYFDGVEETQKEHVIRFINVLHEKEKIQTLKSMNLDTGRANYSVKALKKLLPHMREGKRPDEARDEEYPNWRETRHDNLKRVGDSVVQQALNETKKAIKYAIKRHGGELPAQVVIELSRDMKLSQEKRGLVEAVQGAKKRARDAAWEELTNIVETPNEQMCKKYILWQEQGEECAYCGKCLEVSDLQGNTEIDHIVPQGYGGQSNHANLAVVCRECNQIKGKKLPMEAFAGTKNENAIKTIAEKMKKPSYLTNPTNPFKAYYKDVIRRAYVLLRENKEDFEGDFRLRQNSETAWIGIELTSYLKQLLNIKTTDRGKLEDRVYVTRGTLTAYLRRKCGLNTLIPDIRKEEKKPVFNRKGVIMDDGGEHHCGSWHDKFADNDKNYEKRTDHRHHAVDAAVIGLVDRSIFIKATKHYKDPKNHKVSEKDGKKYPTLDGFEKDIVLQNTLRPMLKTRLLNYIVWHKPDRKPIEGFFDENIYRCKGAALNDALKRKTGKKLSELADDTFQETKKNLEECIEGSKNAQRIIKQFTDKYSERTEKTEKAKCKNALSEVEKDINKLIKRKTLAELVGKTKTFEATKKNLELIVGESVKSHIIKEFERRYHESTETKEESKCKNALCGADADDSIFYPAGTKNKIKRMRVYHKVTVDVGTYKEQYDKIITVQDSRKKKHNHVLNNAGYACFEIVHDEKGILTYKPVAYHTYWTKGYQQKLKNDDGVMRIYKNDIIYDLKDKEYYVVKQLHTSSGNLKCVKTTETMGYGEVTKKIQEIEKKYKEPKTMYCADTIKKAKQLIKDFGKTKINDIQVIKSRGELVDSMNTHEPSSDRST